MAIDYQPEVISPEDYETGKRFCVEFYELESGLYTLRTKEPAHAIGNFAVEIVVNLIGKYPDDIDHRLAYDTFNSDTGEAVGSAIRSVDDHGVLYQGFEDKQWGCDMGYFLPLEDEIGMEDGKLVARVLLPVRRIEKPKLLELPKY